MAKCINATSKASLINLSCVARYGINRIEIKRNHVEKEVNLKILRQIKRFVAKKIR